MLGLANRGCQEEIRVLCVHGRRVAFDELLRLSGARAAQQLDFGRYYDPATAHGKPETGAWVYLKKSHVTR